MSSKKVILWPVIISLLGHFILITASSLIDLRDKAKAAEIFTVNIKDAALGKSPLSQEEKEVKKEIKKTSSPAAKEINRIDTYGLQEDTVDLEDKDAKYMVYLDKIKRKILQMWEYPQKAYENNEEGVTVVKMSLDSTGSVIATILVSSSGSILLDTGTQDIIRAASPFDPLPANYGLARLHVVASFRYKLAE